MLIFGFNWPKTQLSHNLKNEVFEEIQPSGFKNIVDKSTNKCLIVEPTKTQLSILPVNS